MEGEEGGGGGGGVGEGRRAGRGGGGGMPDIEERCSLDWLSDEDSGQDRNGGM